MDPHSLQPPARCQRWEGRRREPVDRRERAPPGSPSGGRGGRAVRWKCELPNICNILLKHFKHMECTLTTNAPKPARCTSSVRACPRSVEPRGGAPKRRPLGWVRMPPPLRELPSVWEEDVGGGTRGERATRMRRYPWCYPFFFLGKHKRACASNRSGVESTAH